MVQKKSIKSSIKNSLEDAKKPFGKIQSIYLAFPLWTVAQNNQIDNGGGNFLLLKYSINKERRNAELENHHFAVHNELIDPGIEDQWLLNNITQEKEPYITKCMYAWSIPAKASKLNHVMCWGLTTNLSKIWGTKGHVRTMGIHSVKSRLRNCDKRPIFFNN